MPVSLQPYKIVVGSSNTYIYEDPVAGSNGTAVATKINGLIDAIESGLIDINNIDIGSILVGGDDNQSSELQRGPNGYVLTSDDTSALKLSWQPRVDLQSNQTIGGVKTFTSALYGNELNLTNDLNVDGDSNLGPLIASNTELSSLEVTGSSLLSTTTIVGRATIDGELDVGQVTTLRGAVSVLNSVDVSGNITAQGAIEGNDVNATRDVNAGRHITATGNLTVGSALINNNTRILGNTVIEGTTILEDTLEVRKDINALEDVIVGGTLTTNGLEILDTLSVANDVLVGRDVITNGQVSANGPIRTNQSLSALGTLSITGNATIGNTTINGTLSTSGNIAGSQGLNIVGQALINGAATIQGLVSLSNNLDVLGNTELAGALLVGQSIIGQANLSVSGPITTDDGIIAQGNISTQGSITTTDNVILGGDLTATGSGVFGGSIAVNQYLTVDEDLTVGGATQIGSDLSVNGLITSTGYITTSEGVITPLVNANQVNVANGVDVGGALLVNGATALNGLVSANNGFNVVGNTAINGDLSVTGNITGLNLSGTNTGDEVLATSTIFGIVRTYSNSTQPIVYLKSDVDTLFLSMASMGMPGGWVPLGNDSKIDPQWLPSITINQRYPVNSEAEMLALAVEIGDIALRLDTNELFLLTGSPTNPQDWVPFTSTGGGGGGIQSVFGRVGPSITAQSNDYMADLVGFDQYQPTPTSPQPVGVGTPNIIGPDVQSAIEQLTDYIYGHLTYENPHSITPQMIGAVDDDDIGITVASLVAGKVPLSQMNDGVATYNRLRHEVTFGQMDLTSSTLEVYHNLNVDYPSAVTVWNNARKVIIPDDIVSVDNNTIRVELHSFTPLTGSWTIVIGR